MAEGGQKDTRVVTGVTKGEKWLHSCQRSNLTQAMALFVPGSVSTEQLTFEI